MSASLRRGLAAGLTAGVLAGLFAFLIGESSVGEAIRLEELQAPATSLDDGFSVGRDVQQLGLVVATALVGTAIGGLFGLVYAAVRRRVITPDDWVASLQVGLVGYLTVSLLPALKYAPNPPAAGDSGTVGTRTGWYLAAIALSATVAVGAWLLAGRLRRAGVPVVRRHLTVGTIVVVGVGAVFVLPSRGGPIGVPPGLLWDFRLSAYATQLVLWVALTVVFGLLTVRTHREARL